MKPLKFLVAGLLAISLAGVAHAADFYDSTLTIQGKTLDLGAAGRTVDYAGFTISGKYTSSDGSMLDGNLGANDDVNLSGSSKILGNVTLRKGRKVNTSGSAGYTGSLFQSPSYDTLLDQGKSAASLFSSNISSLTATTNYTASSSIGSGKIMLDNQSLSITATNSNPVVLKLTDFKLDDASTFTLVGTATSKYIINVSKSFSLDHRSNIVLSGGLLAGNVVFNYTDGSQLNLKGGSTMSGLLVAYNAKVALSGGSILNGELIAKEITLSGGSKVRKPARPSPF